ncbi:MAG: guanylate kinase [Clostridia bacterium]|nr:guanylate kinase [Clostridia bacterium]
MNTKKGTLLVVSGPAGSGKGTVNKVLLENTEKYVFSVSATTRKPRPGEVEGIHYFFMTRERFMSLVEEDNFLEHAEYVGNCYGTLRPFVEENLAQGKNVILDIEVQGALQVREKMPEALLVFLCPPDYATLERRLRGRGTETEEVIQKRLKTALTELQIAAQYDYLVVNEDDKAEECAAKIDGIIDTRPEKNKEYILDFIKNFTE